MRCYITGKECNCGAFDVAGTCPFDEDLLDEDDDDHPYGYDREPFYEGKVNATA